MTLRVRLGVVVVLLLIVLLPGRAGAQPPADGRLTVTVVDPSRAVIPNATVTLIRLDGSPEAKPLPPAITTDKGAAILEGLIPGRYSIRAEFAGFEPGILRDVRLTRGDNKHVVV